MAAGVFLGLTTVDIISYVNHYPSSNEKVRADQQLIFAGGPATNAAVAYAAFCHDVTMVTGLGTQALAGLARADLISNNIRIIDLNEDLSQLPVLSSITVDISTGNRSVVYTDTTQRELAWEGDPADLLEGASVLMLDGFFLEQACDIAGLARRKNIPVVLDGGSWKEGLDRLLPYIDYAICSENFIPPGCDNVFSIAEYLITSGIANVSISRGAQTILAWSKGQHKEISIDSVEVVDTLGAGDILHGAFCHYIKTNDFFTSLGLASTVASCSCKYRGTRKWIEYHQHTS